MLRTDLNRCTGVRITNRWRKQAEAATVDGLTNRIRGASVPPAVISQKRIRFAVRGPHRSVPACDRSNLQTGLQPTGAKMTSPCRLFHNGKSQSSSTSRERNRGNDQNNISAYHFSYALLNDTRKP
ncbi:hypothetical protein SKAU_G00147060 [Synaphobranchus kaupii]|uniref:Uncharacterized protein n=1 Tax=Synaphobranchus kaupii TaxID=118154 RepID=A0A9Q1FTF1_SYNKA|nr:hypothetical protein SKAU_G00147060 [Synaphobranchus kaupii]